MPILILWHNAKPPSRTPLGVQKKQNQLTGMVYKFWRTKRTQLKPFTVLGIMMTQPYKVGAVCM